MLTSDSGKWDMFSCVFLRAAHEGVASEGCLKPNPARRNTTRPEMRVTADRTAHAHRTVSREFLHIVMIEGNWIRPQHPPLRASTLFICQHCVAG
jgi:hypothetical protein